jgi:hypothetical protein
MFADYVQFKAPLLGTWITHSQSDKAAVQGPRYFPFTTPIPDLGPNHHSLQWEQFGGGDFPWNKSDQALKLILIECRVKNTWSYTSNSPDTFTVLCLIKARFY